MVLDYSQQRQVSKNRPRKQPAAFFIVSLLVTASIAFLLGIGTGWLIFSPSRKNGGASATVNQKKAETVAQNQPQAPAEPPGKAAEPSLTFYETLPKGNRELMGSGLNLPKPANQAAASTAPRPKAPTVPKPAVPEEPKAQAQPKDTAKAQVKATEPSPAKETAIKEGEGKGKFVVQVASYHVRKEAEEARDRLKAGGVAAYVVEINIPEKGTYYRVRVGRHLNQKAAREMAEKTGKESIVIPE